MGYDYGRFVWFELMTTDKEHATTHYPEILSWKLLPMEMPRGPSTTVSSGPMFSANTVLSSSSPRLVVERLIWRLGTKAPNE